MDETPIQVLSDHLINQIAAGEVVENPASVVKELLENAIDAGATRVGIEVENGGASLLRVSDNGCGMSEKSAELALKRHATSKIANLEDLQAIRTLGFRGEALPSIASVSRFTLETCPPDSDLGTRIAGEGVTGPAEPCACPMGTTVTVRDLFFNVPARLKFQKGERSRTAAIRALVIRCALASPALHVTLKTGARKGTEYPSCDRFLDRAAMLLGRDLAGRLHEFDIERDGIQVSGVLGEPSLARPDPSRVILLVNNRPIVDLSIRRAVLQAYSVLIPQGRYPVAAVRIELDPAQIDVNVHPRKTEVRFRHQREVASVVFGAVQDTVVKTPWIDAVERGQVALETFSTDMAPVSGIPFPRSDGPRDPAMPLTGDSPFVESPTPGPGRFSGLRYVGQVANSVLICEGRDTLVVIDQHAAHERVNFEKLWIELKSSGVVSESLLFPEVVHLSTEETARFEDVKGDLSSLGFDLEAYSGDAVAVRAVPAVLKGRSAAATVRDCIAAASEESEMDGASRIRKVVATVACHASVRAGDELTPPEVRALLAAMDDVDLASYCPHGRQSVVVYPMGTVLRWFGR